MGGVRARPTRSQMCTLPSCSHRAPHPGAEVKRLRERRCWRSREEKKKKIIQKQFACHRGAGYPASWARAAAATEICCLSLLFASGRKERTKKKNRTIKATLHIGASALCWSPRRASSGFLLKKPLRQPGTELNRRDTVPYRKEYRENNKRMWRGWEKKN